MLYTLGKHVSMKFLRILLFFKLLIQTSREAILKIVRKTARIIYETCKIVKVLLFENVYHSKFMAFRCQ